MVILPWPEEPMFSEEKITTIRRLATDCSGGRRLADGEIFTVCLGAIGDHKAYNTFSVQADLFRGAIVAALTLEVVVIRGGGQYGPLWFWGPLYSTLIFLQRYQHFEYLAAKSVFEQFLRNSVSQLGSDKGGTG